MNFRFVVEQQSGAVSVSQARTSGECAQLARTENARSVKVEAFLCSYQDAADLAESLEIIARCFRAPVRPTAVTEVAQPVAPAPTPTPVPATVDPLPPVLESTPADLPMTSIPARTPPAPPTPPTTLAPLESAPPPLAPPPVSVTPRYGKRGRGK